jgi:N-carbamoyl-L-amino-acid hydrolase
MDERLRGLLQDAAKARAIRACDIASGAGHDAATFAAEGVPTAMLFVRNRNGSHNPDEQMDLADLAGGVAILADTLEALATASDA